MYYTSISISIPIIDFQPIWRANQINNTQSRIHDMWYLY